MLVLSRKLGEEIVIGDKIIVKILRIGLEKVRLGIEAPKNIPVHRWEVHEAIQREIAQQSEPPK